MALYGALAHALAEVEDGVDVAGDLEVEGAAFDADDVSTAYGIEGVVGLHAAEGGAVLAAHDDVVGVFLHQGFEAVVPALYALGDVAATGHADDVVDEGVASGGEVAARAEAHDIVDLRQCFIVWMVDCVSVQRTDTFTHQRVQRVGLMLFAHKAAYGRDVVVEGVEARFFNHAHHRHTHLVHLVGSFLAHHGAADDEVGGEGEDTFDVEVADATYRGYRLDLGGIGAEIGAPHEESVGPEGKHNLRNRRRETHHALRA